MATAVAQTFVLSSGLSGTNWPMSAPSAASNQLQLMFLFATIHAGTTTPTSSGWTPVVTAAETTDLNDGLYVFQRTPASAVAAGSVPVSWTGVGATGFGWVITLSDAQYDSQVAASVDFSYPGGRTLGSVATTSGGARIDVLLMRQYRTATYSGGTGVTNKQYTGNASGGLGGVVRIQTGVSTGSTAGTAFTYVNSDPPNAPDSQSIGYVFSVKPLASGGGGGGGPDPILAGNAYMADATPSLAPDTPTSAPVVSAIDSTSVNVTVSGWDTSADTIKILRQEFIGGVAQTAVEVKSISTLSPTFPQVVTGMIPGKTYRFFWYVVENGMQSAQNSPSSALITMGVMFARLLVDSSAAGANNIDAQVWLAPTGTDIAGEKIASATGLSFNTALSGGQAVLIIPLGSYTGPLSLGQSVVAVARKVSADNEIWTRIAPATIAAA